MSRFTFEKNNKLVAYGYDRPLSTYFIQVYDLSVEDKDEQLVEEYANNPMSLLTENGKRCSNSEILEKLIELGCENKEHLNDVALDIDF